MSDQTRKKLCPCHSGLAYTACCEPFHLGTKPKTALQLMRSRYAAYAIGLGEYIIGTTHSKNPNFNVNKEDWLKNIQHFSQITYFKDLTILNFQLDTKESFVTFHAILMQNNKDVSFKEKSRFLWKNERWLYVDGIFL